MKASSQHPSSADFENHDSVMGGLHPRPQTIQCNTMNKGDFPVDWPVDEGIHRVRMRDGRSALLKRRSGMPPSFFESESLGLGMLAEARALRVPEVWSIGHDHLLLEDLGTGTPEKDYASNAGKGLARQHQVRGDTFGLGHDGWCGDSPQDNTPDTQGARFFAQRRLLPQARRAHQSGRLDASDLARVDRLTRRLPDLIPEHPAVLLHGDLWSGNLHCCGNGEPALIDAGAAHFGWAEADLAMLTLFGDPGADFFAAYREHTALDRDWRERAPLYNLYHLLNHLNLFGGAYLAQVQSILRRFTAVSRSSDHSA